MKRSGFYPALDGLQPIGPVVAGLDAAKLT